jgi:hypothetical protein
MRKYATPFIFLFTLGIASAALFTRPLKLILASDAVIRQALDHYERGGQPNSYTCGEYYSPAQSACYGAREGFFYESFGPDWSDIVYMPPSYRDSPMYRKSLDEVRNTLKEPANLKEIYLSGKDKLLVEIRARELNTRVIQDLSLVLPMVDGSFTREDALLLEIWDRKRELIGQRYRQGAVTGNSQTTLCDLDQWLETESNGRLHGERSLYLFQWVQRRRAEGGDKLLEAYAWVTTDLLRSLQS